MRKRFIVAVSLLALAFCLEPSTGFCENTGDTAEIRSIQQLQKRYVESIDKADTALVDEVWSHSPDVIFIEPLGTERGLSQVEAFVRDTFGKTFSKRDLQLESPSIHVDGDSAWSEMTWTFHAIFRDTGQPLETKGRETQIFHREHGAWHIIAIHYSGLPVKGRAQGF